MRISVASGKGGTGKTTLAVNMALALSRERDVDLMDFDVEEPDCSNFLGIGTEKVSDVMIDNPVFNRDICTRCGECGRFCRYNAIAVLKDQVMLFPELCNGCGGCAMVCPVGAISYTSRRIGEVRSGQLGALHFHEGVLVPGEAKAVPVIDELMRYAAQDIVIMDSPPGTSCPMMATVRGSDHCILVTEPTPFGLHDLRLAVAAVREIGVEHGIVINRYGSGDSRIEEYAKEEGIEVLLKIPQDMEIARLYSDGIPFVDERPDIAKELVDLYERLEGGSL